MRVHRSILYSIPVTLAMLTACTSNGFILGKKYLDSEIRTVIIDTCTVTMTSVSIDSIVTSGRNAVMTGSYTDTTIGKTDCITYLSYTVPTAQSLPVSKVIFDSLEMVMALNGNWLGDTTTYHTYNIYPLTEVTEIPEDEDFYSNWSLAHDNQPLLSFTLRPGPNTAKRISVRLPDSMGSGLLQKIIDDDEEVLGSQERFLNYFKGFAITAGDDNNAVLGIHLNDTSMALRIHYHYSTYDITTGIIEIPALQARCFYGASTDRTGTAFERLQGSELVTTETCNEALIQGLTASYVRIEFPYLNNLLELGDYGTIIKAALIIYPVKGTYSDAVPLPPELSLYVSDENNVSLGAITTYSGDALQTGDLTIDDLYNINTYYSYDITSYMKDQLGAIGINKRNLEMIIPEADLAVTLNTLIAGDNGNSHKRAEIKITYLIYEDK